ncbi:hypothetical protein PG996_003355 [Apiospora saccharicola]|uniref:Transmembrane protein n=1 Tax=Apiospora saccharicola TaxID=335842 RepID=A0ABR1W116_9PEZI
MGIQPAHQASEAIAALAITLAPRRIAIRQPLDQRQHAEKLVIIIAVLKCLASVALPAVVSAPMVTTDSNGHTVTSEVLVTTTISPTQTTAIDGQPGAVPKVVATTMSKIPAISTSQSSSSNSTGLSAAALGGIIAGVVVVLIAVIVAAFVIVRRLRRTEKIVEASKRGSSNGHQTTSSQKSHKPGLAPTVTEVDIDPLSQSSPSLRPSHYRGGSDSSVTGRYSSPARSPPLSDGRSTPPAAWPGHYKPVLNGEYDGPRHHSMESMGGQYGNQRVSYDSQTTYRPGRWSNASEVSGSADGAHGTSELDGIETTGRRRSSGTTRAAGSRRQSTDSAYRGRSESAAAGTLAPLEAVNEAAELHGYYGPQDQQVGQTAARPTSTGWPLRGS